jgi:hypothetical protein
MFSTEFVIPLAKISVNTEILKNMENSAKVSFHYRLEAEACDALDRYVNHAT